METHKRGSSVFGTVPSEKRNCSGAQCCNSERRDGDKDHKGVKGNDMAETTTQSILTGLFRELLMIRDRPKKKEKFYALFPFSGLFGNGIRSVYFTESSLDFDNGNQDLFFSKSFDLNF
jgi:hypothetical protein